MKNFLRRQGHRLALGGAAAAWIVFGAASLRSPDAVGSDQPLRRARERFHRSHPSFAAPAAPPAAASHRAGWTVSAGEQPGSPWASALLPAATGIAVVAPPAPPPPPHPTVDLRAAARGPYAVDLEWTASLPDARGLLERRDPATGAWTLLPAQGKRHTDETATPGRSHDYRIRLPEAGISATAKVDVPGIWSFAFQSPIDGAVSVTITKHDRTHGLVKTTRLHRSGERIGWWTDPGSPEATATHWISLDGRPVKVDFDGGITLVSILPTQADSRHRRCRAKATPVGVVCEDEIQPVKTPVSAIRLASEGREWTVLHPAPEDKDLRCVRHRGR